MLMYDDEMFRHHNFEPLHELLESYIPPKIKSEISEKIHSTKKQTNYLNLPTLTYQQTKQKKIYSMLYAEYNRLKIKFISNYSFQEYIVGIPKNIFTGYPLLGIECEHSNLKMKCKICFLRVGCSHTNYSYRCKICNLCLTCEHLTDKFKCVQCNFHNICMHSKYRYGCITCKLPYNHKCKHSIVKMYCEECTVGKNICIHSIRKSACDVCLYADTCKHAKHTFYCDECTNPKKRVYNLEK